MSDANPSKTSSYVTSLATMGLLFFVMGFFTWINGPLITFVGLAFDLDEVNSFFVLMVFYLSYFFLALPASLVLRRTGMKKGMSLAILILALGAALFGEFSTARYYPGALLGLFVIGGGLSMLQTAVNPYVSILGPIESASRRIALMGMCNKFAGMMAPLIVGTLVLSGLGDLNASVQAADAAGKEQLLNEFAAQIRLPYLVMAGVLVLLSFGIRFSSLPEIKPDEVNRGANHGSGLSIFSFPRLWLGVLCLFLYVGAEVMAGDAIGTYAKGFDLPLDHVKFFTSFTLFSMLVGYMVGIALVPRFISQEKYLAVSALLGLLFTSAAFMTQGYTSVMFVAALGFANAMMWPAIFPLSISGLGKFTETGSALLIMGIAGGAIIPQMFAVLKQHYDFQWVFIALMVPCYLYIAFFSIYCGRGRLESSSALSLEKSVV